MTIITIMHNKAKIHACENQDVAKAVTIDLDTRVGSEGRFKINEDGTCLTPFLDESEDANHLIGKVVGEIPVSRHLEPDTICPATDLDSSLHT